LEDITLRAYSSHVQAPRATSICHPIPQKNIYKIVAKRNVKIKQIKIEVAHIKKIEATGNIKK